MAFSPGLASYLRKGSFPLKAGGDVSLWIELITALETSPAAAVAEAKALSMGLAPEIFDTNLTVNGVAFTVGLDDFGMFLGAIHAALSKDFDIYNRKGYTPVHGLILRVRAIAAKHNLLPESSVTLLPCDADLRMGTGLVCPGFVTYQPDPGYTGPGGFGSQPDQAEITRLAPQWAVLKRRAHENHITGAIGRKTHYVLAHLLNHQIGGSGSEPKNVVPFYADANTAMARQAEVFVKELVQRGVPVKYDIAFGAAVGMTPGRQQALDDCATEKQREVIRAEQYLPSALIITIQALDKGGNMVMILNAHRIDNFVPETVPVI